MYPSAYAFNLSYSPDILCKNFQMFATLGSEISRKLLNSSTSRIPILVKHFGHIFLSKILANVSYISRVMANFVLKSLSITSLNCQIDLGRLTLKPLFGTNVLISSLTVPCFRLLMNSIGLNHWITKTEQWFCFCAIIVSSNNILLSNTLYCWVTRICSVECGICPIAAICTVVEILNLKYQGGPKK